MFSGALSRLDGINVLTFGMEVESSVKICSPSGGFLGIHVSEIFQKLKMIAFVKMCVVWVWCGCVCVSLEILDKNADPAQKLTFFAILNFNNNVFILTI